MEFAMFGETIINSVFLFGVLKAFGLIAKLEDRYRIDTADYSEQYVDL